MKNILIALFISFFLYSCKNAEPATGEWYENIDTGKQHKIEYVIDSKNELERFNKDYKGFFEGKIKADSSDYQELILRQKMLDKYAKEGKKLYALSGYRERFGNLIISAVITQDKLERDFKKIQK